MALGSRWGWFALAALAVMFVATVRGLTPVPFGAGTHTQLGLPPCGFERVTGLRCAGCGVTTSLAFMARFRVESAVRANPLGVPLFLAAVTSVLLAAYGFATGLPFCRTLKLLRLERGVILYLAGALCAWAFRTLAVLLA